MAISDFLSQAQGNLRSGRYPNESAVREAIVLPVLGNLGWEIYDPLVVRREYAIQSRRVDYALFASGLAPKIIIEVKSVGAASGGDTQLFEYAFHEGVPMAILTDGQVWSFYLPGEAGKYDERRVYKLDLLERSLEEACTVFGKYLAFERVKSGEALEAARRDYKEALRKRQAEEAIPLAWRHLVDEPDDLLIDLLAEKAQTLCGYVPERDQVVSFLQTLHSERKPLTPPGPVPPKPLVPPTPPGTRRCSFSLRGKSHSAKDATDALLQILQLLHNEDSTFFERLAVRVRGRNRNHIARSKAEVYPGRQDLLEYTREIVPGWWIGTNIANREKRRIIERACEVAGIRFGRDLTVDIH